MKHNSINQKPEILSSQEFWEWHRINHAWSDMMVGSVTAVKYAEKAFLAAKDQAGWQPIETAPKDGTWIDLWGGERFPDCKWGKPGYVFAKFKPTWCYWAHDVEAWIPLDERVTHWMPLPEPPDTQISHEDSPKSDSNG